MKINNKKLEVFTIFLIFILLIPNLYAFTISQSLGWAVAIKQGNWQIKALCVASSPACESIKFLINPEGYVTGKGLDILGESSPEIQRAINAIKNPKGAITETALQEIAKENPEAVGHIGEVLQIKSQLEDLGIIDGNLEYKEGKINNLDVTTKKNGDITKIIGKEPKNKIIVSENIHIAKNEDEKGITTLTFSHESNIWIGENNYKDIKEGGFIKLNEDGTIIEADIISVNQGGYVFAYQKLLVDADTRITYKNGKIEVYGRDKIFELLNKIGNRYERGGIIKLLNSKVKIIKNEIFGENFQFNDIKIKSEDIERIGSIRLIDIGYEIRNAVADLQKERIQLDTTNENSILIVNPNIDISDYKGSWIKQTDKILEMKANEYHGNIKLRILPNNPILNTNDKTDFNIILAEKGHLVIINRKEEGKIPQIKIYSSGSYGKFSTIDNAANRIIFDEEGNLDFSIYTSNEQAIPYEIITSKKTKLRTNHIGQIASLSPDGEQRIILGGDSSAFQIKISDLIKDNILLTYQEINKKWSKFLPSGVPKDVGLKNANIIDMWLKMQDPKDLEILKKIEFYNSEELSNKENNKMKIPENTAGYAQQGEIHINKGSGFALFILDHEFRHVKDFYITSRENQIFNPHPSHNILKILDEEGILRKNNIDLENYQEIQRLLFKNRRYIQKYGKEYDDLTKKLELIIRKEFYSGNSISLGSHYKKIRDFAENKIREDPNFLKIMGERKKEILSFKEYEISKEKREELLLIDKIMEKEISLSEIVDTNLHVNYLLSKTYQKYIPSDHFLANNHEPSAIFKTIPIDEKIRGANSNNPIEKEIYRKLTQLDFDSDKMTSEEYKQIMKVECKTSSCIEHLCIEYKFLCCIDHPYSPPNCK